MVPDSSTSFPGISLSLINFSCCTQDDWFLIISIVYLFSLLSNTRQFQNTSKINGQRACVWFECNQPLCLLHFFYTELEWNLFKSYLQESCQRVLIATFELETSCCCSVVFVKKLMPPKHLEARSKKYWRLVGPFGNTQIILPMLSRYNLNKSFHWYPGRIPCIEHASLTFRWRSEDGKWSL